MAREPNHFVYEDDEFGTEGIEIIPPPEDPVAELDAEIARVDAILKAAGEPVDVADAVLPLYISRKVLNAEEVLTWAREQGFENLLDPDELHVTQAYSRQPLEWFDVDQSWEEKLEIGAGGPRAIEMFGSAVVLRFASRSLQWRFEELQRLGASWDWADYKPHVTLSYAGSIPPGAVPYQGRLELGPEIFEEIDDPSFFADAYDPNQPRDKNGRWTSGSSIGALNSDVATLFMNEVFGGFQPGTAEDREMAVSLLEGRKPMIAVPESALNQVMKDGRFKSGIETGKTTRRYKVKERAAMEDMIFRPAESDEDRPIYGFFGDEAQGRKLAGTYGGALVELHPSVMDRSSITFGDSLNNTSAYRDFAATFTAQGKSIPEQTRNAIKEYGHRPLLASRIDDLDSLQVAFANSRFAKGGYFDTGEGSWKDKVTRALTTTDLEYIEAQYRNIGLADIKKVTFTIKPPSKALEKSLTKAGIEWEYKGNG